MKKAFIRSGFLAVFLAALALSLTSCSDLAGVAGENAAPLPEGKAVLSIRLGSSSKARTALPEAESVEFSSFTLEGVPSESGYQTVSWQSSDGIADAEGELTTAEIVVTKGLTYTFTLTATTSGGAQYKDSKNITIQDGENTLSFSLTLVSLGTGGTGSAVIGVTLPETESGNEITRLTVTVYTVSDDGTINSTPYSSELNEKEIPVTNKKAGFDSGDLPPGAYCAVFRLYGGEDGSALAGTWREFFGILGGLTSKSEINPTGSEKAVDELYAITYHANDTEEEKATITAPKCYSRNSVVTLEAVMALSSRPGNKIEGWYTDQACTVSFTSTAGMTGDIELWAKWNKAYKVIVAEGITDGTVEADMTMATAGETVTVTVTPDEGHGLKPGTLSVTAESGDAVSATQDTGDKKKYTFIMPESNVTVTAEFINAFTVTFFANGGTGSMESQLITPNVSTPLDVNTFTRTDYKFLGWATSAGGAKAYNDGGSITVTGDTSLYAVWELKFRASKSAVVAGDIAVQHTNGTIRYAPQSAWPDTDYAGYSGYTEIGVCVNSSYMINLVNEQMNWNDAMAKYPKDNWRMPTKNELKAIYNVKAALNTVLGRISGAEQLKDEWYWSSEPDASDTAWVVYFANWIEYGNPRGGSGVYVRVVRDLQ